MDYASLIHPTHPRQSIDPNAERNPDRISRQIPQREDAPEQQRPGRGQPERVEPRHMHQPGELDHDRDRHRNGRDPRSLGSKTPTSRNTIVAHSSEPPYFTTKAGRPSGKP